MQLFIQHGWKQPKLKIPNQCRMYLKVFLLSDIVLSSGITISAQFCKQFHLANSPFDWPRTPIPTLHSWYVWKKALTEVLHLGRNQGLSIPLGKWSTQTSLERLALPLGNQFTLGSSTNKKLDPSWWYSTTNLPTTVSHPGSY